MPRIKRRSPGFLTEFFYFDFFFCSELVSLFSVLKVDNENEFPKSLVGCLGGLSHLAVRFPLREMKQAPAIRDLSHFARASNYYELSCRGKPFDSVLDHSFSFKRGHIAPNTRAPEATESSNANKSSTSNRPISLDLFFFFFFPRNIR